LRSTGTEPVFVTVTACEKLGRFNPGEVKDNDAGATLTVREAASADPEVVTTPVAHASAAISANRSERC
jgi:hypothetical protein